MADQTAAERVLPPSPRKLQQARERGNVAKSQDLSSGVLLLVSGVGLFMLGPLAFRQMMIMMEYYFGEAFYITVEPSSIQALLIQALLFMIPMVAPLMLLLLAFGIVINITQIGFVFSSQALKPKPERINPIKGVQRMVSIRALVELVKSLTKLSVIGFIAYLAMRDRIPELISLMHQSPAGVGAGIWSLVFTVWWRIGLAMIAIGILDFGFQRWQYMRDNRMTRQEAQDEMKQLEGDPKIKQRIRQIQRQMAMQRMMTEVPEAEVVVTNPTTFAVAIRYDAAKMESPKVVAKGARRIAERIRDLAIENEVPIVERPELARALFRDVEIGGYVPEDLFRVVAEVLAYVYEIDQRESKLAERAAVV